MITKILKTVVCASWLFSLTAPAMAEEWIRAESENFVIYSSAPEKKTRTYVKKLEAFRTLNNLLLGSDDSAAKMKFRIYLLNNPDQMLTVRPNFSKYVAGVYFNCSEGTSAYSAIQPSGNDQDQNLTILFHEYAHYVMFQHARSYYPAWYVEGFAEYLSTADPDKSMITIGEVSAGRGYTLAEDRWISFEKVLDPDFGFAGDKHNDAWEIQSFYAQSWLLAHYMLSDSARAKALNAYFVQVGSGAEPVASWETATGIKVNTLHSVLERYQQKMFYLKLPVQDYADAAITVSKMPTGTEKVLLNSSLLTTCPDNTQGKAILSALSAQKSAFSNDTDFRLGLAHAQILYGDPADAETELKQILSTNPASFKANYLLGRTYMKQSDAALDDERSHLTDQARASFLAAYKINRLDAPNLYYLAQSFGNQPDFPDTNTLNAANGAHVLAPGVIDYTVFAAYANLANDKRDKAVALLTPFVSDPHNRQQAEKIQKAIEAIKAGKSTNEVMKLLSRPTPPAT